MSTGTYSRVTGLLIYYDEPLELIAAHVASLSGVIDHLVAVDGAFGHYPGATPSSDPEQTRLISEICSGLRIGLTLHVPSEVWIGNEVEKRNHSLALAEAVTREDGWYVSMDMDEIVTHVSHDWFEQLAQAARDGYSSAEIGIRETRQLPGMVVDSVQPDTWNPIRNVYRAYRGLQYGPAHFILHAPFKNAVDKPWGMVEIEEESLCIRGPNEYEPLPSFDATHLLKFDHRQERPDWRNVAKRQYYERRGQLGFENYLVRA